MVVVTFILDLALSLVSDLGAALIAGKPKRDPAARAAYLWRKWARVRGWRVEDAGTRLRGSLRGYSVDVMPLQESPQIELRGAIDACSATLTRDDAGAFAELFERAPRLQRVRLAPGVVVVTFNLLPRDEAEALIEHACAALRDRAGYRD